jgi:hypothetical protein
MKLRQLTIKDFAGLRDRTFSFADAKSASPCPVTLLTGGPQSGKTSLLHAIAAAKEAVGAYGAAPHPIDLVSPGPEAKMDATWELSAAEQRAGGEPSSISISWDLSSGELPELSPKLRDMFARFSCDGARSKVDFFPARRALDTSSSAPLLPKLPDNLEGRLRLRDTPAKYSGLLRTLHDISLRQAEATASLLEERGVAFKSQLPDGLAAYKAAVAKMCPTIRLVAVEPRERGRPLVWFQTKDGARVELAGLSDSELAGFLFAGAFIWLGLNGSLVLIDTPELHIHPDDQVRLFRAICELGTDNQIIAATTSPALLASVAPEQIIDLSKSPEKAP